MKLGAYPWILVFFVGLEVKLLAAVVEYHVEPLQGLVAKDSIRIPLPGPDRFKRKGRGNIFEDEGTDLQLGYSSELAVDVPAQSPPEVFLGQIIGKIERHVRLNEDLESLAGGGIDVYPGLLCGLSTDGHKNIYKGDVVFIEGNINGFPGWIDLEP